MGKIYEKLNMHIVRRLIFAAFCFVIGVSVCFVMFNLYDPTLNSIRALCSVCMDVVCIVILIVLIISLISGKYGMNRTTRQFSMLLISTIWALFLDFLNWAFDGSLALGNLAYWFTVGSLCMGSILACIFSLYLYSYMEETHNFSIMKKRANICALLNMGSFVLTFILAISGVAFKFVGGHYETGVLYNLVTAIPVLTLVYLTFFVIRHVKTLGIHDVVAVAGYIFFMVAGAIIESEYSIGTTYVAVSIADIFIFAMLQNEIIGLEKRRVQEWKTRSNTDELTGLNNRYAYETDLDKLEDNPLDEKLVYVSVDVNSLKKVNDTLGHNAGDEMLIGASECLKKCFGPYGKLYRNGGDEFIAIIYVNEEKLSVLKLEIEKLTENWKGKTVSNLALSCGYVTKKEAQNMSIKQMAVLADQRMYEAKDDYYRRTGIERRKY